MTKVRTTLQSGRILWTQPTAVVIALGSGTGQALIVGDDNVYIDNIGQTRESGTIRIGTQRVQTATYIAGISGTPVTGDAVVVSKSGQLGIVMSSARYKHDIRDMGTASSDLLKLRPVTFRYNNDPSNAVQYGLVAEEVDKIMPAIVSRDLDGKVQTVRYMELIPMLVNELQKQAKEMREENSENERQAARGAQQAVRIHQLTEQSEQQAAQNRQLVAQVSQLRDRQETEISALQARLAALEHVQAAPAHDVSHDLAEISDR